MKNSAHIPRPVIQQDPTGCAIACAAVLTGLPYARVRNVAAELGIDLGDPPLWTSPLPMRALLARLELKVSPRETPFKSWQALPDRALLAIKWHIERGAPHWHWTVFVRNREGACVLDSKKTLKSHRRTDFGRMHPKWFIEVCSP